jgi:predicted alpha/beta-fold hydrolase
MTTAYLSKGFSCCLVSFRGCNGRDNDTPGAYHLGFTKDLDQVCRAIYERRPDLSIYVSGFSLGGNVALKYLGELGEEALRINVHGGVATCVPFDPAGCQGKIDKGFNRAVYSMNFLKTLKTKAERQIQRFPGSFDIEAVRKCDNMGDFDDAYIAKIYGFKDKFDYYYQTGSIRYLNRIRVPAIAINAIDDPFIEASSLPTEEDVGPIAPVRLIYHEKGGHCGFCAERSPELPEHGWLAEELARALEHIHTTSSLRVSSNKEGCNREDITLLTACAGSEDVKLSVN